MSLRTKLVLAFLLLAIVPLSSLTLYSYYSSIQTFRRVAEAESAEITQGMSDRMEVVTRDLNQSMNRLQNMPFHEAMSPQDGARGPSARRLYRQVITEFGDAAEMISALEFRPRDGSLSAGDKPDPVSELGQVPPPPDPPAPPGEGELVKAPQEPDSMIFYFPDSPQLIRTQLAAERARRMENRAETEQLAQQAEIDLVVRQEEEQLIIEAVHAQKLVTQFQEQANQVGQVVVDQLSKFTDAETAAVLHDKLGKTLEGVGAGLKNIMGQALANDEVRAFLGKTFDSAVSVSGERVGTIRARIDARRVMNRVFSSARRRQGEIPFALGPEGNLFTAQDEDREQLASLNLESLAGEPNLAREMGDWLVVTRDDTSSGMTFGIARPIATRFHEIQRTAVYNLLFGLGIVGIALVGILPLSGRMTRNLETLTQGARKLATGDLQTRVLVKSNDEFGKLASTFNQMAVQLKDQQEQLVHQERIRKELEMCRLIQEELLPQQPLRVPFAEVKGVSIPAREVGGDFFNYFPLVDGKIAILIGDVSGKGVAAALLMANLQATLRARVPIEPDLAKLARELDEEIYSQTPAAAFLTLFLGILDGQTGILQWVNAGHNPQYALLAEGKIERLESGGRPLGLIPGGDFEDGEIQLRSGDSLFLYTDGLVEAENAQGEEFGEPHLEAVLAELGNQSTDAMLARIEESVRGHRAGKEAGDDATMVVLRIAEKSFDLVQNS